MQQLNILDEMQDNQVVEDLEELDLENSDWKKFKLGDLVTFQRGHDLSKSQFVSGTHPIVGSNGIIGYHNVFTTKAPGITIGRSGNLGIPQYIKTDFWAHNTTLYVKEFHNSDPKFIYYLLKTLDLKSFNSGSAVPSLNRNFIHPLEVYAPKSKNEQQKIAKILSSLDDKIELNQKMNKTLEEMAQAIFKHWFIDFEFPNEEGKPYKSSGGEMVDSELGEIPKGWEVGKLDALCNITSSKRIFMNEYIPNGIPFYRSKEIIEKSKGNEISTELFISEERYNEIKSKFGVPIKGDILLTSVGTLGVAYLVENDGFYFKDGNLTWFRQFKEDWISIYIFSYLSSTYGKQDLDNISIGSTQKALTIDGLKNLRIAYSKNINVFQQFNKLISSLINKFSFNTKETKNLIDIRDSLLPKFMSGEIRVNSSPNPE